MAYRQSGREPIHGLTMERPANVGYIADTQKRWEQTWAVGFYNFYGAYTIGKFWEKPWEPTLTDNVKFPEGTVAFKLLFTEATEADVPSLAGSPEWQAAIAIPDPPIPPDASDGEAFGKLLDTMKPKDRGPKLYPLRLIQVDIMVRDSRADKETGWVFGTFMYHKDHGTKTKDKWRRLVPLCLQWGNDPDLTPERYYEQGIRPNETWTNPLVKEKGLLAPGRPYLGYLERANGIVDNFISCCASCHSTASIPTFPKTLTPSKPDLVPNTMDWFKNIHAGEPFEEGGKSLDYSLQLDSGLSGYFEWVKSKPKPK
ncbi:uncharacterized protein LOC118413503 [Branchiostoma floridae]|uniref:Uncharacterized protein LOC118413503 n=1 Tax=Branchiostoma floridae TaxID=7739 RepID=A0A9J7KYY6_BRAFL|nr:uncharacterized protein LOC118413503 [Branchiostoma floridae]